MGENWVSGDGDAEGLRITEDGDTRLSGHLLLSSGFNFIACDTSWGTDTGTVILQGGGAEDSCTRGAQISVSGNNEPNYAGQIYISAGNVSGGDIYITVGEYHRMITLVEWNHQIDLHDNPLVNTHVPPAGDVPMGVYTNSP